MHMLELLHFASRSRRIAQILAFLAPVLLLQGGCSTAGQVERKNILVHAHKTGFSATALPAHDQPLTLWRQGRENLPAIIVVESDGLAYLDYNTPSPDPTPNNPYGFWLALYLASALPNYDVVYAARPCQFLDEIELPKCSPNLWLGDRFGKTAQALVGGAIPDELSARRKIYVGVSGGGVIAAHLALKTNDANMLIGVAAPLALNDWAEHHNVKTFSPSDDPAEYGKALKRIPTASFAGKNDKVVPAAYAATKQGHVFVLPEATHANAAQKAAPRIAELIKDQELRRYSLKSGLRVRRQ